MAVVAGWKSHNGGKVAGGLGLAGGMATKYIPLAVSKRVPLDVTIDEMGVDYTGATLLMHVRTARGGTGTPLLALSNATPPTQGLSVAYSADLIDPEGKLPNGGSSLRIMIDEATLEALPSAVDTSKSLELHYDVHVTPIGSVKFVFCGGEFIVDPGVTV
jgi:hypothetical protein